jgi:hypothetical protein
VAVAPAAVEGAATSADASAVTASRQRARARDFMQA